MRVVAGSARGIKLQVVPGEGTRPIMDRVKTALGDILRPRLPGMHVLDLFGGSGSVGIEALSQGAAHCTFTELGHRAIVTIKKNLKATALSDRAEVLHTDAFAYLQTTDKTFDLIYIAPPQYKRMWIEALQILAGRPELLRRPAADTSGDSDQERGLAIVQIDPKEYEAFEFGTLTEVRQKRYGSTLLLFFEFSDGNPGMAESNSENEPEAV
jgi:16S rRNA (guanine(966)-N(2))-methyltransferase RsmD